MAWEVAVPAALSVIGAGTRAAGTYKGGQARSAADIYRAQVSRNMAAAYGNAAERVMQGGAAQSDIEGLRTAATVGRAKVSQAASGIDVNTGSAVDVRAGLAQAGRLNQLTTLSNAALQGYGYRVKQMEAGAQAGLYEAEAPGETTGAAAAAAGSLFSSASSLPLNLLTGGGGTAPATFGQSLASGLPELWQS